MRIVYAALRTDYGDPTRGPSFEEQNFLPALTETGHEVFPFDYLSRLQEVGYELMNRELVRLVDEVEPDLLFCVLFEEQLDRRTLDMIRRRGRTLTFNWFCDDHWRFDGYSRHWAPHFDWFATTDRAAFERYQALGLNNVTLTQWACNPATYTPGESTRQIDVSFVGQPHDGRRERIERLRRSGCRVDVWGQGWDSGRVDVAEMVDIFRASRISLNFAGASVRRGITRRRVLQLKARPFEIAACGGFVLTENTPDLADWLTPGLHVATFDSDSTLAAQVARYLRHVDDRDRIAAAGCAFVRERHTYQQRFEEVFAAMGLAGPKSAEA